jgi:acyl carrier protein
MTTSPDRTIEQRIEQAIARALKMPPPNSSTPLRMGSTPGWDSMGHMMVVMELEKEFDARFPPYLLPQLLDVPSIAKAIRNPA